MVILGLLILLVAVAAGAAVYLSAATLSGTYSFDILGAKVTTNPLGLVLASAVVVLVFWFGWGVLRAGMRRSARRRREAKEADRQAEAERAEAERQAEADRAAREQALQEERDQAQAEAERLRSEADARAKEQQLATETARQRAEVAEQQLRDQEEPDVTPPDQAPPPPPPTA
jgi:uncharacterized membrane protein